MAEPSPMRLDVEGSFFLGVTRTARLAIEQRLRDLEWSIAWAVLFPPAGWGGRLGKLEMEQDSHLKASANLAHVIDQVEALQAKGETP